MRLSTIADLRKTGRSLERDRTFLALMIVVCPFPHQWVKIHQMLEASWAEAGGRGEPPPAPLILSGWVYSNDFDKLVRWKETVQWAASRGLQSLIDQHLHVSSLYVVDVLSEYEVGPGGGPMYLSWNASSRVPPTDRVLAISMKRLSSEWESIAGHELAAATRPVAFTGRKKRRLLVEASAAQDPPWGTWQKLSVGPERRAFTRFRASINDAIAPHSIDHISFIEIFMGVA